MTLPAPIATSAAVLFDWNGTVVLDADRARRALNRVLRERELGRLDAEAFRREFHLPMADMFRRLGVDDAALAESEWNNAMMASPPVAREGAAGLRSLAASGVRLGVVSAASRDAVQADMTAIGLDLWASVDAPAVDKLTVLRRRRGAEERAFYVGDTVYDMACARAAGYTAIGVDRGYTVVAELRSAGADHIISTFDQLPGILSQSSLHAMS